MKILLKAIMMRLKLIFNCFMNFKLKYQEIKNNMELCSDNFS